VLARPACEAAPRVSPGGGRLRPQRSTSGPRHWPPVRVLPSAAFSRYSASAPVLDETLGACARGPWLRMASSSPAAAVQGAIGGGGGGGVGSSPPP
jgi:hypothetical protein